MQPFLYQVAEDLKQKFGKEIAKVAVVFNNKRPIIFLKKYLSEVYGKTILCPAFFTIQDFMALSTKKAIAHDLSRFFLLFDCYNQLLQEEGKELISSESFYPMSQTILSDFDQIDYERVNPEALYTHLKDIDELKQRFSDFTPEQQQFIENFWSSFSPDRQAAVQQKFIELWKRLPELYKRFHKKMSGESLMSMASAYRRLAEGAAEIPDFISQFQQVAFVGFNALSKCEATLFKGWQGAAKALFYFDGDEFYFKDPVQEAGMFLRKSIQEYGLKNALGAFPNQLNLSEKELITYPIAGNTTQAKALPIQLKYNKEVATPKPNRIGVILADENLLVPTLQSISDDSIINITMGYSIRQSSIFPLIQSWISIQQQLQNQSNPEFSESDINKLLTLGLPEFTKEAQELILNKFQELSSQEFIQYLRNFNEVSKLFFTKNDNGILCLESLKILTKLILHQKEETKTLKQLESSLLLRVFQELTKLQDRLNAHQSVLTIGLTLTLTHHCLSGLSAPLAGEPLEGIQVMGMLESRCLDFNEVYILSANDGLLPYSGVPNTFIPDSLRRAFGMPVKEYQEALSAYLFYRLCQRAERIHIFYNSLVDNNSNGEISRFVSQLAFESRISIQQRTQLPYPQGVALTPKSLTITKTNEILEILNSYKAPNKKSFSASALKKYLECPLQFFLQYIARIKEPQKPVTPFDPAIMGTAFHQTMQDFYKEFVENGTFITKEIIQKKLSELPKICKQTLKNVLRQQRYPVEQKDSRMMIAEKILLENAKLILKHDAENVVPFKILELENDCSFSLPLDIYRNGQPEIINFKGIIDRIDEVKGQIRIVDYKTGGDSIIIKDNMASLFSHQTKQGNPAVFQILFYTFLYYKKYGNIAAPHLYVIRNIAEKGSSIQLKEGRTSTTEFDFSEQTMSEFENNLGQLMATIFNSNVPFVHNPNAQYCSSSPYALFCNAEEIPEIEEPATFK